MKFNYWLMHCLLLPFAIITIKSQPTFEISIDGGGHDFGYDIIENNNSEFLLTGKTSENVLDAGKACIIKLNEDGSLIWEKVYGGSNSSAVAIQAATDNGYVIALNIASTNTDDAGDVSLIKIDEDGELLWQKNYGGPAFDFINDLKSTSDNCYILFGYTSSFGPTAQNFYAIKVNQNGDTLWTKTFVSSGKAVGMAVEQTSDNGFIFVGEIDPTGMTDEDILLIKTDSNGNVLWEKSYDTMLIDSGIDVVQANEDGYIIAGRTQSKLTFDPEFLIIKVDETGDTLWTKTFGSAGFDTPYDLLKTSDGNFIFVGLSEPELFGGLDLCLIKFNYDGNIIWTKYHGGEFNDSGQSIKETSDNGFICAGSTRSYSNDNHYDIYVVKTDEFGEITHVVEHEVNPRQSYLSQNYPNPFNPATKIKFSILHSQITILKVYDILGREIKTMINKQIQPGEYEIEFDAYGLNSGIYFYQLISGQFCETRKMIILK